MDEHNSLLDETKEVRRVSYIRGGLCVAIILTLYVLSALAGVPLQSQYINQRLLNDVLNFSNTTIRQMSPCVNATGPQNIILEKVQSETSTLLLHYSLCSSIPAILINLVFGSYSDFLGRKVLFFVPICGELIRNVIITLVIKLNLPMNFFFLGSTISGLTGSFTTVLLASFAYTADITPPKKSRTIAIASVEAVLAIAASGGSLLTGFLIHSLGFFYPSLIITILLGVDLLVVLILPESLKKKEKIVMSPIVHLKKCFGFFTIYGTKIKRIQYNLAMVIIFFAVIGLIGRTSIETLFQLNRPFCWNSVKIGYYGALKSFVQTICSVIGIKVLQPCLRDEVIGILGMVVGVASYTLEALSYTDWMLYLVPIIGLIANATVPIFRSIMSRMTSAEEQGAIFSSIATMETICSTVSITLYNTVYSATVGVMRGAVFLMMAGFCAVAVIIIIIFMLVSRGSEVEYQLTVPERDEVSSRGSIQGTNDTDEEA